MKKAILLNALRGVRVAGEIIVLADMVVHFVTFTRQHIIPRLCKKTEQADKPVVDDSERSE